MADDERRAEIEAVADTLRPILRAVQRGDSPHALAGYAASEAVRTLDRLRDARGDDEGCPKCGKPSASLPAEVYCVDCATEGWEQDAAAHRAARSTQGEDHEAGIEAAARALQIHYRDRALAVDVAGAVVAAYLSRMSPSRDGTVAVENVESLTEALRPFVAAYDAVGRTFCPEFNGPEALAHFDRAAEVLAEFEGES